MNPWQTTRKLVPRDKATRTVLLVSLAGLLLVILLAIFAPPAEDDPVPATWNSGKAGAKASLLLLSALGDDVSAPELPMSRALGSLSGPQAARTTLILAEPGLPPGATETDLKPEQDAIQAFLKAGGAVLATGANGARLLGRDETHPSELAFQRLCLTSPEGAGPLARAGSVPMATPAVWGGEASVNTVVSQRCGNSAVVVRWSVGAGTATWWSSATPLTNQGLHNDPSLRLLLAAIAPDAGPASPRRNIIFGEYFHGAMQQQQPDLLGGLPLPLLAAQALLVALLMVFSFSRRHGPVLASGGLKSNARSSPVEFAQSMGALYSRAGAAGVPVEAAERRLRRALTQVAGVPAAVLEQGPAAVAQSLADRFGAGDAWDALGRTLARIQDAEGTFNTVSALTLVRALDAHTAALPELVRGRTGAEQAAVFAAHGSKRLSRKG